MINKLVYFLLISLFLINFAYSNEDINIQDIKKIEIKGEIKKEVRALEINKYKSLKKSFKNATVQKRKILLNSIKKDFDLKKKKIVNSYKKGDISLIEAKKQIFKERDEIIKKGNKKIEKNKDYIKKRKIEKIKLNVSKKIDKKFKKYSKQPKEIQVQIYNKIILKIDIYLKNDSLSNKKKLLYLILKDVFEDKKNNLD